MRPALLRTIPVLFSTTLLAFIMVCCNSRNEDVIVVSKTLMQQTDVNTAVPLEFGGMATSSGFIYWIEGKVRNAGATDLKNVVVAFACTEGKTRRILSAEIPLIPAGRTVDFKTPTLASKLGLQLLKEEPEITVKN
jgi:hypothetical protein